MFVFRKGNNEIHVEHLFLLVFEVKGEQFLIPAEVAV